MHRREFYMIADLSALTAHLDIAPIVETHTWQEWHIGPISGGASRAAYSPAAMKALRRIAPNGIITTVAGGGALLGNGGPAMDASMGKGLCAWAVS